MFCLHQHVALRASQNFHEPVSASGCRPGQEDKHNLPDVYTSIFWEALCQMPRGKEAIVYS